MRATTNSIEEKRRDEMWKKAVCKIEMSEAKTADMQCLDKADAPSTLWSKERKREEKSLKSMNV